MSYFPRDTSSHVRRFTLASTILRRNLRTFFSIVSKPPTQFFIVADSVFFLSKFHNRGFKTTASGFSNHRPVVQHTDRGFPEHRPVFQSGFHYLCTDFRTIGRGFSRDFSRFFFSTTSCFLSPHTDGVFYASLISFFSISFVNCYRSFPCNLCLSFPRRHTALVSTFTALPS